jgi:hypothetical protein
MPRSPCLTGYFKLFLVLDEVGVCLAHLLLAVFRAAAFYVLQTSWVAGWLWTKPQAEPKNPLVNFKVNADQPFNSQTKSSNCRA